MDDKFPLASQLKGKMLKIAELQDKIVIDLSSRFGIILHGGTAIWRVYRGKRFSFDIDIYYNNPGELYDYFEKTDMFDLVKNKLTSSNVLYSRFKENQVLVEVDASPIFRDLKTTDGDFRLVGGDSIVLRTLGATEMLKEKIDAFRSRRKSRDLYDIFHLLDSAESSEIRNELNGIMPLLNAPPKDFTGLNELILIGKTPDFETIVRKVKMHAKAQI